MIDAFVFELSKCDRMAIRTRMVAGLRNVDEDLAQAVADGLGLRELPDAQYDATGPGDAPTAEMEILHGELSRLLIDHLDGQTELITGDHVTAIADGRNKAEVSFENGTGRAFDLIIVAEGTQ